jgi:hypothetical protein
MGTMARLEEELGAVDREGKPEGRHDSADVVDGSEMDVDEGEVDEALVSTEEDLAMEDGEEDEEDEGRRRRDGEGGKLGRVCM